MLALPRRRDFTSEPVREMPGLEGLLEEIVEPRAAVLGDQLAGHCGHPGLVHGGEDLGMMGRPRRGRSAGGPPPHKAQAGQRELGRRRRGVEEQGLVQAHQLVLQGQGRGQSPAAQALKKAGAGGWGATLAVTEMQPWPPWAM